MPKFLPMPEAGICDSALRRRGWDQVGECWIHRAKPNRKGGYTLVRIGGHNGPAYVSSRLAYTAWVGAIPEGHLICHTCDNPPCINPEHLFTGTMQQNIDDMWAKGRGRTAKHSAETAQRILDLRAEGLSYRQIEKLTGVSAGHAHRLATGQHRHRKTG